MEEKPLTVLCVPLSGLGHINATLGLSLILKSRGHRIIFATERSWTGKFDKLGLQEEIYDEIGKSSNEVPGQFWSCFQRSLSPNFRKPVEEQIEMVYLNYSMFIKVAKFSDGSIKEIISRTKPDVIIQDNYVSYPSIVNSGIPVVRLYSANPIRLFKSHLLPPGNSGYPLNSDRKKWDKFVERELQMSSPIWTDFNDWLVQQGCPRLEKHSFMHVSSNLNMYLLPKALMSIYLKRAPLHPRWVGLDHCVRPTNETFEVPEKLKNLPGKLIYVSMGSMGSSDVELMKLLVAALSNCPHRFIVSLGQAHAEYSIAENMWGKPLLPQQAILKKADLAIIHGGNNSFTECLYYGKPMILVPLFMDQHDNAQLAEEANVGRKFGPFSESAQVLKERIEFVLSNQEILENVLNISRQMQASSSLEENAKRVEILARNPNRGPFTA